MSLYNFSSRNLQGVKCFLRSLSFNTFKAYEMHPKETLANNIPQGFKLIGIVNKKHYSRHHNSHCSSALFRSKITPNNTAIAYS